MQRPAAALRKLADRMMHFQILGYDQDINHVAGCGNAGNISGERKAFVRSLVSLRADTLSHRNNRIEDQYSPVNIQSPIFLLHQRHDPW